MNNLFSTFDPQSWLNSPLNWMSRFLFILLLPRIFWCSHNQAFTLLLQFIKTIFKEFSAILLPKSNPGFLVIPIALLVLIASNNALGLIPYTFTSSRHITFTVALALPLWLGHMVYASTKTPNSILAHLVPLGTPVALMPFMVLIETVRRIIRPLTLSVRLAANMIAGHLLLALMAGQATTLSFSLIILLIIGLVLLCSLECAVRLIQAYVFRVLSTLYVNEVNSPRLN